LREFGRVDVWVNNAGRGIRKTVMELSDQDLNDMLDVNLKSVLNGIRRCDDRNRDMELQTAEIESE